jgi:hypothetical protein
MCVLLLLLLLLPVIALWHCVGPPSAKTDEAVNNKQHAEHADFVGSF